MTEGKNKQIKSRCEFFTRPFEGISLHFYLFFFFRNGISHENETSNSTLVFHAPSLFNITRVFFKDIRVKKKSLARAK